ncbi:hypothetical protein FS749_008666 [Ceratobasidium sp. UAMH 11750]|nr:hypothetical protein FS749_008666 [Ceratobasidium sp. UAMH 11750]
MSEDVHPCPYLNNKPRPPLILPRTSPFIKPDERGQGSSPRVKTCLRSRKRETSVRDATLRMGMGQGRGRLFGMGESRDDGDGSVNARVWRRSGWWEGLGAASFGPHSGCAYIG